MPTGTRGVRKMQESINEKVPFGVLPYGRTGYEQVGHEHFARDTHPSVVVIIRSEGHVLVCPCESGELTFPMVQVFWPENYLAAVHRAFMGPLQFGRRNLIPRGKSKVSWQVTNRQTEASLPIFVETFDIANRSMTDLKAKHAWVSVSEPVRAPDGSEIMSDELIELVALSVSKGPTVGEFDEDMTNHNYEAEVRA